MLSDMQYRLCWVHRTASSNVHRCESMTKPQTIEGARAIPPLQWTRTVPPLAIARAIQSHVEGKSRIRFWS